MQVHDIGPFAIEDSAEAFGGAWIALVVELQYVRNGITDGKSNDRNTGMNVLGCGIGGCRDHRRMILAGERSCEGRDVDLGAAHDIRIEPVRYMQALHALGWERIDRLSRRYCTAQRSARG